MVIMKNMKTVDLEKYPEEMPKTESSDGPKPYCPTLYITGKKLADMPTSGKAEIEYRLKRQSKDFQDGEDSYDLEVVSITYTPAESEADLDDKDSMDQFERNSKLAKEEDSESEEEDNSSYRPIPKAMQRRAKIDSSKGNV